MAAGLPYQRIVTSQTFAEVSDKLRHKFKYSLAENIDGTIGSPLFTIEEPTVKLAGKTLALSFKPATKIDEDIIASYLPKNPMPTAKLILQNCLKPYRAI